MSPAYHASAEAPPATRGLRRPGPPRRHRPCRAPAGRSPEPIVPRSFVGRWSVRFGEHPLPWVTIGPVDRVAANSARSGLRPQGTKPSGRSPVPATSSDHCLALRRMPLAAGAIRYPGRPASSAWKGSPTTGSAPARHSVVDAVPGNASQGGARRRFTNCSCSGQRHREYLACLGWSVPHGPPGAPTNQQRAGHRP